MSWSRISKMPSPFSKASWSLMRRSRSCNYRRGISQRRKSRMRYRKSRCPFMTHRWLKRNQFLRRIRRISCPLGSFSLARCPSLTSFKHTWSRCLEGSSSWSERLSRSSLISYKVSSSMRLGATRARFMAYTAISGDIPIWKQRK